LCKIAPREHVQERGLACQSSSIKSKPAFCSKKTKRTTNRMRHLHIRLLCAVPVARIRIQKTIIKSTATPMPRRGTARPPSCHEGGWDGRTGLPLPKDGLVDDEPHNGIRSDGEEGFLEGWSDVGNCMQSGAPPRHASSVSSFPFLGSRVTTRLQHVPSAKASMN
jgi:hypothetical protein